MKPRVLIITLLLVALTAASALAATSPPKKKRTKPARWHEPKELQKAVTLAKKLGRPVALLWQASRQGPQKEWKDMPLMKYFVCIMVDVKIGPNNIIDLGKQPKLLTKLFQASGTDPRNIVFPMLFLGTLDGEFLGMLPSGATGDAAKKTVRTALKKFGKMLPASKAVAVWKKLETARKLWAEKKYLEAMPYYREVATVKDVNPKLPILKELETDRKAIEEKGAEALKEAENLSQAAKFDEAKATVRVIYKAYQGFETAKAAKELFAQIEEKQKEHEAFDEAEDVDEGEDNNEDERDE